MKRHSSSSKPPARQALARPPNAVAPVLATPADGAGADLRSQLQQLQEAKTQLQQQQQALQELQRIRDEIDAVLERYADLYDFAPISYFTLDRAGLLQGLNLMGAALLGLPREQAVGRPFSQFVDPAFQDEFAQFLQRVFSGGAKQSCDLLLVRPDAPPSFVHLEANVHDSGQSCRAMAIDISERKHAEDRLLHLAHHDPLTGLPNRALFSDRLRQAIARAKRERQRVGLIYIDLDKFKAVNDSLGHEVGDLLLKEMAARMQRCVRGSDTVARIGGDEFVILLPYHESLDDVAGVAGKVLAALEQPLQLHGHSLQISASLGAALFPEHGTDADALVRHADAAMYQAKQQGGGRVAAQLDPAGPASH